MQKGFDNSEVGNDSISNQKYSDVRCLNMFGEWRRCICESCSNFTATRMCYSAIRLKQGLYTIFLKDNV